MWNEMFNHIEIFYISYTKGFWDYELNKSYVNQQYFFSYCSMIGKVRINNILLLHMFCNKLAFWTLSLKPVKALDKALTWSFSICGPHLQPMLSNWIYYGIMNWIKKSQITVPMLVLLRWVYMTAIILNLMKDVSSLFLI